jgi:hypothetical protein
VSTAWRASAGPCRSGSSVRGRPLSVRQITTSAEPFLLVFSKRLRSGGPASSGLAIESAIGSRTNGEGAEPLAFPTVKLNVGWYKWRGSTRKVPVLPNCGTIDCPVGTPNASRASLDGFEGQSRSGGTPRRPPGDAGWAQRSAGGRDWRGFHTTPLRRPMCQANSVVSSIHPAAGIIMGFDILGTAAIEKPIRPKLLPVFPVARTAIPRMTPHGGRVSSCPPARRGRAA